jgi:hypothetical protein
MSNHDRLERRVQQSEIARNLAIVLAAIGGAVWAWYHFSATKEAQRATSDFQVATGQLREIQQRIAEHENVPSLDISFNIDRVGTIGDQFQPLQILVQIENKGKRDAVLWYKDHPLLSVAAVTTENGNLSYETVAHLKARKLDDDKNPFWMASLIPPGGITTFAFLHLHPAAENTLYYMEFKAPMGITDQEEEDKRIKNATAITPPETPNYWTAATYYYVDANAS